MGELSKILRSQAGERVAFWCPGCDEAHAVTVTPGGWQFDGNNERPTFAPSILVTGFKLSAEGEAMIERGERIGEGSRYPGADMRCHSFVREGLIEFLSDCTHELAGKTVPIPPWPSGYFDGDSA